MNGFGAQDTLSVGGTDDRIYRIDTVPGHENLSFSLKVLLDNQLRTEDGKNVTATRINPLAPAEMVIDHSVIADLFGTANALERNTDIEYERNGELYQFLSWGQRAFDDFKVVPPGSGIVHQINIEHLARVTMTREVGPSALRQAQGSPGSGQVAVLSAYPDTLAGTDSPPLWSTGSACSVGVLAELRRRRPCWVSRYRC